MSDKVHGMMLNLKKFGPCSTCGDFKKPCRCYLEDEIKGQGIYIKELEKQLTEATATFEKMRLDILKYHNMGMGVESCKECDRNWLISRYVHHVETAQKKLKLK